jgi:hypothetical protein
MIDATNPWIDMARVAVAPTLTDDLKVRGQAKIDDDLGEGPTPKGHPRPPSFRREGVEGHAPGPPAPGEAEGACRSLGDDIPSSRAAPDSR